MGKTTREEPGRARNLIFKVGSSLLADPDGRLDVGYVGALCDLLHGLIREGRSVTLVSSGAVVAGMSRLRWARRPESLGDIQVAAAVGQMCLADTYAEAFAKHGLHTAQVLLTAEDMSNRTLYLNARSMLRRMGQLSVVPVVNENDAVALEGLRFGDNDRLAAMVANLIEADLLALLTDQEGLLDRDRQVVPSASAGDPALRELCFEGGSPHGSGGMESKLDAAAIAARGGTHTVIMGGRDPGAVSRMMGGEPVGTLLRSGVGRLNARKRWFAHGPTVCGRVEIDEGAVRAILANGRSLLPVGVRAFSGKFGRGDVISCNAPDGRPVAQGLTNFSSDEVAKIIGRPGREHRGILGYDIEPELIHRDNMAIIAQP